jgi:CsoR family transcriptional regulator, copper-sensing transcriptional repressor
MTTTTAHRRPTPEGVAYPPGMDDYHRKVTNRLKTARGHLDGIIRMVEDDAWCPDIMKQLAAVQGMLEGTSREVFRHHLESHVADAIRAGRGDDIVDELMETLKYDKRVLRPIPTDVDPQPADGAAAT